jgi:autotransporter-associated beta strand protein/predicted outer membrane repeat protein
MFIVDIPLGDVPANAVLSWDGKALTKAGEGTLVLEDVNTYSGQTKIQSGTIGISSVSNLGALGLGGVRFESANSASGAAVATLHIVDGASVVFDSLGGTGQRLVLAANTSGRIDLGAGASFTVAGNDVGGADGGAVNVGTGAIFDLTSADGDGRFAFIGNKARYGGAIYSRGVGVMNLTNAVFIDNVASQDGGGIYMSNSSGAVLHLHGQHRGPDGQRLWRRDDGDVRDQRRHGERGERCGVHGQRRRPDGVRHRRRDLCLGREQCLGEFR